MADLIVAATSADWPPVTVTEVLEWARTLDPEAGVVTSGERGDVVVFRHPAVGEDRAAHATFEVRPLSDGGALAVDGVWPEYVDVAVFFRERLPAEAEAVMYDEAGNHVLDIPVGASRVDLAARWLEIAG